MSIKFKSTIAILYETLCDEDMKGHDYLRKSCQSTASLFKKERVKVLRLIHYVKFFEVKMNILSHVLHARNLTTLLEGRREQPCMSLVHARLPLPPSLYASEL
jgi:hypothetical protein